MTKFHAVMVDETGCEFGVDLEAEDIDAAEEQLSEDYPESRMEEICVAGYDKYRDPTRDWEAQARYDEQWR